MSLQFITEGQEQINVVVGDLLATDKQVKLALTRTLNKTAMWLRTHAARDISKAKRLPQKLIKQRINMLRAMRNRMNTTINMSVKHVRPEQVGRVRQTAKGARVRSHKFDGAFVAKMQSRRSQSIYKRKGKARLPIQVTYIPIEEEADKAMSTLLDRAIEERLDVLFERELNFILNHQ